MTQTVDYSFARPDPGWIASSGYVGVMRYLAPLPNRKVLDARERDALHAAGLAVGVVWETTADRAGQGFDAGRSDAARAEAMADDLGFPADRPIYYAVDFDARPEQVAGYFDGVAAGARRPWGVYGSYRIVEAMAPRTPWLWQCAAWSGSGSGSGGSIGGRRLSAHAVMFQRVGYVLGDTSDANDVLRPDWGGWHPGQTPPAPNPTTEVDEMASLIVNDPDDPSRWWEIVGLERRLMNTVFGRHEIDVLAFLGAKVLDETTDADARRFWIYARVPVVTGAVDAKAIAEQVVAAIGAGGPGVDEKALAGEIIAEIGRRFGG